MNPLQEWLEGPQDYEAGRLLYEQLGSNHVLKRTLSHGPNAYNVSALREELRKLHKAGHVAAVATPPGPPAPAPAVVETVIASVGTEPAAPALPAATVQLLAELEAQWKPLYKDASYLQGLLPHAKDNQERCTWSFRILDLMDEVQARWDKAAYVQEHGQLPPEPVVTPPPALDLTDHAAVLKRRNGLRSQISKQKHNAARAAEVAAWKEEVAQLTNILTPTHAQPE